MAKMQAKPGFVRPEDDPEAVAARKNCGGATEKAEQQSQYAKSLREDLSGEKFEFGRSMTMDERGMYDPSKKQVDPDAPARPCPFYAACPKYSIKAQIRRVTR